MIQFPSMLALGPKPPLHRVGFGNQDETFKVQTHERGHANSCAKANISLNELFDDTQQFRAPPKIAINYDIFGNIITNGDENIFS